MGGKARDAIRPTGNAASLARLRFLRWLETLGAALPQPTRTLVRHVCTRDRSAIHSPGTGTGTETGSKTCGHLETRERESSTLRVPRCGTMRARALLYRKSFMRERSRSTSFGTGNGLNGGWSRLTGPNENVRGKYPLPFFSSPRPFVPLESRKKGGKEERRESLLRNVDKAETGAGRIENLVAASIAGGKSRSFFTLIDTHYPPTDLLWNWSDEFCVFLTGSRYATSD